MPNPARPGHDEPEAMFRSVAEVARLCCVSKMTVYRAIAAGEFPAVRIQGRLIVPAKVIEAMAQAAIAGHTTVDAADWATDGTQHRSSGSAAFPLIAQPAGTDR
ncbi:MAG: helix-turn-helix domain-containing protein [Pseudonocardia sp.]|uniref:helix-turn-helix domain-containing protein n=1 Tax=Pseudonocardia sp. TaxID=60912 RepID=UPI001AD2D512|nr:helix-turn-helix domain-containing protein [Pseudonocardia sp.]MBN9099400.1 helix-turn-helix domain-containing protein [Pseudonocardia sp.]